MVEGRIFAARGGVGRAQGEGNPTEAAACAVSAQGRGGTMGAPHLPGAFGATVNARAAAHEEEPQIGVHVSRAKAERLWQRRQSAPRAADPAVWSPVDADPPIRAPAVAVKLRPLDGRDRTVRTVPPSEERDARSVARHGRSVALDGQRLLGKPIPRPHVEALAKAHRIGASVAAAQQTNALVDKGRPCAQAHLARAIALSHPEPPRFRQRSAQPHAVILTRSRVDCPASAHRAGDGGRIG
eukprot:scaffold2802_cov110-Isochrysis_galbana.AAC.10